MGKWSDLAASLEQDCDARANSDISASSSSEAGKIGPNGTNGTNVTGSASAIVAVWRDGLASLDPDKPRNGIELRRWRRMLLDGDAFLNDWGEQAAALGWTADNLFACPPNAGRRLDMDGLVTGLEGRLVVLMTDSHAMIDAGGGTLWRHERRDRPGAVLWWWP